MINTGIQKKLFTSKLTKKRILYQNFTRFFIKSFPFIPTNLPYNITICNDKKFIWFRVPKVGTRTILNIFEEGKVALDVEHYWSYHYPPRIYWNYFKFAFVRNPWDRLVSCWNNKVVDGNYFEFSENKLSKMQNFKNFVDYVADRNINYCDQHIRLQSKLIDLNNIDYIGRYERFEQDLYKVNQILGLGEIAIEKKGSSLNRMDYKEYYDEYLIQKVADIYSKDINIFSYDY